jgi:hypothetical protein
MVKQKPVGVRWQSLFVLLPYVWIWAQWRIQKLRKGIVFWIMTEIVLHVGEIIFIAVYYHPEFKSVAEFFDFLLVSLFKPSMFTFLSLNFISPVMAVYHIHKWSKEWNEKFSSS